MSTRGLKEPFMLENSLEVEKIGHVTPKHFFLFW